MLAGMLHPKPEEAQLTPLVYELLDAHDDTARVAAELAFHPHRQVHLGHLRDLQPVGREALAGTAVGQSG
jgi:hypothetical protein